MSYVDAIYDKEKDVVRVIERVNKERITKNYPAEYVCYYEHPHGTYKTMWNKPCKKYSTNESRKFHKELQVLRAKYVIHESDINPVFRCLEGRYLGADPPELNVGFLDIEVDFDTTRGFADPWDPFSRITAISVYLTQHDQLVTLVLKPDVPETESYYLNDEQAQDIVDKFEHCYLCGTEAELLQKFFEFIYDTDVLSGWNSSFYDIPYLVNRVERVLGKSALKAFCWWGKLPTRRDFVKFKKKTSTYDLVGRVHLDYLELYMKHNQQSLHSYRLDFVGELEVKEHKVPYEGTLDMLYKKDFEKFIAYNRQDTLLLYKIDQKRKFIELANQLAHTNSVLLQTTMGSVALIEQAIANECHARGMVVPNKKSHAEPADDVNDDEDDDEAVSTRVENGPAVGAYVAKPKVGIHDHIGCCDINSLYPSTLRALNMGPETLVGQIRCNYTDDLIATRKTWDDMFCVVEFDKIHEQSSDPITITWTDGRVEVRPASDVYDFVYKRNSPYCLSANGTFFRTDVEAIIPGLLKKWYAERQQMQAKEYASKKLANAETDPQKKKELLNQVEFWNQRQFARKILLNSLYGAILNEHCRFYDYNIGQSVTLTGRSIVKHMNSKINEIITGTYQVDGDAIIYADTDSSYFSVSPLLAKSPELKEALSDRQDMIAFYDQIAKKANSSFPEFMHSTFNTGLERGEYIRAGRELVGSRGLFITKKRYAILMYDKEGQRLDLDNSPGKIKAMGLDLKRSDTPKMMQEFLERILLDVLNGISEQDVIASIKEFRQKFRDLPGWLKGTPKKVNSVIEHTNRIRQTTTEAMDFTKPKKISSKQSVTVPGHVQASLNWNMLREKNKDRYSMEIQDGQKIIVCKLKPKNDFNITSIAYPIDEMHLPDWFKKLPFDSDLMEAAIIDKKIENLLGVLNWNLASSQEDNVSNDLFSIQRNPVQKRQAGRHSNDKRDPSNDLFSF